MDTPSAAAVAAETARVAGLSWREFSAELDAKFARQGYSMMRLGTNASGGAADFRLEKAGQVTLVAAKRYKAATHGVEPLEALVAQKEALGADFAVYVCLGSVSPQAAKFAKDKAFQLGL
ncbi:restriction endonuclease [Rhodoferax sp.]|uniref:restriction endonuclease n=1 Tax=Rhodoferax sp. TaxID=50421 RepID=UPI0025EAF06D|nr:restriction endonuclease [Rhodoferax sp.]